MQFLRNGYFTGGSGYERSRMISRILIPTDPDRVADDTIDYGIAMAEAFDAEVHALSVLDRPQQRDQIRADLESNAHEVLESIVAASSERGLESQEHVRSGQPAEVILAAVEELGIDLVVMGTHARSGVDRVLLGSVAESVIRESPVPVLTVTPESDARPAP